MENIIVGIILVIIFGGAITKVVIDKKNGNKCTGCPASKSSKSGCGCGCIVEEEK